jgi:hypothetical protein
MEESRLGSRLVLLRLSQKIHVGEMMAQPSIRELAHSQDCFTSSTRRKRLNDDGIDGDIVSELMHARKRQLSESLCRLSLHDRVDDDKELTPADISLIYDECEQMEVDSKRSPHVVIVETLSDDDDDDESENHVQHSDPGTVELRGLLATHMKANLLSLVNTQPSSNAVVLWQPSPFEYLKNRGDDSSGGVEEEVVDTMELC